MDYDLTTLDMLCCDWVKAMDVQMYMRVSDKINATYGDQELSVPEKTIMDYDLTTLKLAKTTKWPGAGPFSGIGQEPTMLA